MGARRHIGSPTPASVATGPTRLPLIQEPANTSNLAAPDVVVRSGGWDAALRLPSGRTQSSGGKLKPSGTPASVFRAIGAIQTRSRYPTASARLRTLSGAMPAI